MVQVRFIALCDAGHVQDFPWREWVHETARPTCTQALRLIATGASSLAATRVMCECGASRTLEHITDADPPTARTSSSYLTRNLAKGTDYRCEGRYPWLGEEAGRGCDRPLRGSLRGATNVYFSVVKSAIYLPRGTSEVPGDLVTTLENPPLSGLISLLRDLAQPIAPATLKAQHGPLLTQYTEAQIAAALKEMANPAIAQDVARGVNDDQETAFRRAEYAVLRTAREEEQLLTSPQPMADYQGDVRSAFARVTLVPRLRETRAFAGFARVFPENDQTLEQRKAMLWRNVPIRPWLPAYIVFGEGIYLEVDDARLRAWEAREDVATRVGTLSERFAGVLQRRRLRSRDIGPRLVLLHTMAHLLMNQLTFDCGYGTASLRERLFVSSDHDAPMSGLLVYTAAGDAEGTMGGLVRMGKPRYLESIIRRAIENARWCSADPVCMELGDMGGQGPDSCNLAACHNCVLAPETSCEEFNRFLDRALVVGTIDRPEMGFFSSIGLASGVA